MLLLSVSTTVIDVNLNIAQIDIEKTQASWPAGVPFAPAYTKKFKHGERKNWLVLGAPLVVGEEPVWDLTEHDEYMRVPLFSYTLNSQADLALAFMLQLGLSCAAHLPKEAAHFFVATGTPVELLYDPITNANVGVRCWLGFAVILR